VVTNKWLKGVNVGAASSDALLLEVDRHWCSELRPLTTEPLAKVGDSERRLLTTELTTGLENRDASGLVTDLNNAFTAV